MIGDSLGLGLRVVAGLAFAAWLGGTVWLGGMPVAAHAAGEPKETVDEDGCTEGEQKAREINIKNAREGGEYTFGTVKPGLLAILQRFQEDWKDQLYGGGDTFDDLHRKMYYLTTAEEAAVWVRWAYCYNVCVMRPPPDLDYSGWMGECKKACRERHPWPAAK